MASVQKQFIDLDNFDPTSHKFPIINSPRSLEACKRCGFAPEEIIIKDFDDIKEYYKDNNNDKHNTEIKHQHYEQNRQKKLQQLREVRHKVMEDERQGLWVYDPAGGRSKRPNKSRGGNSALIDKEKRLLEQIKKKQQKEIYQMVDLEVKTQEIRDSNIEKAKVAQQKEQIRQKELEEKKRKQDEYKMHMELQKQTRMSEEVAKNTLMVREREERDADRAKQEIEREKDRQKSAKLLEEIRLKKQDEFRFSLNEKLQKQQDDILAKKIEMDHKAEQRTKLLELKNKERAQLTEQKRMLQDQRLETAKQKGEAEIERLKDDFLHNQEIQEEKRRQWKEAFDQKVLFNKMKSKQKEEKLTQVLLQNSQMEEQKKNDIQNKMDESEERRHQKYQKDAENKTLKDQLDKQKDDERSKVRGMNMTLMQDKLNQMVNKLETKEQILQNTQADNKVKMRNTNTLHNLKRKDRQENVTKILHQNEFEREKLMDKINQKMSAAQQIQQNNTNNQFIQKRIEREQLLKQRGQMRREIDLMKSNMDEAILKLRQGKISPNQILDELNATTTQETFKKTKKEQEPEPKETVEKQPPPQSSQAMRSTTDSKKLKVPQNMTPKEASELAMTADMKHKQEMLRVLEEEQKLQSAREARLRQTDDKNEKKNIEKVINIEKQKAQLRIQKLQEKQNAEIKRILSKGTE